MSSNPSSNSNSNSLGPANLEVLDPLRTLRGAFLSQEWAGLTQALYNRQAALTKRLVADSSEDEKANVLRGRIIELEYILGSFQDRAEHDIERENENAG